MFSPKSCAIYHSHNCAARIRFLRRTSRGVSKRRPPSISAASPDEPNRVLVERVAADTRHSPTMVQRLKPPDAGDTDACYSISYRRIGSEGARAARARQHRRQVDRLSRILPVCGNHSWAARRAETVRGRDACQSPQWMDRKAWCAPAPMNTICTVIDRIEVDCATGRSACMCFAAVRKWRVHFHMSHNSVVRSGKKIVRRYRSVMDKRLRISRLIRPLACQRACGSVIKSRVIRPS